LKALLLLLLLDMRWHKVIHHMWWWKVLLLRLLLSHSMNGCLHLAHGSLLGAISSSARTTIHTYSHVHNGTTGVYATWMAKNTHLVVAHVVLELVLTRRDHTRRCSSIPVISSRTNKIVETLLLGAVGPVQRAM